MYSLKITKTAKKYLDKLDINTRKRILDIFEQLRENPFHTSHVKSLAGTKESEYRIRLGNLRIIYSVKEENLLVIVLKIAPRGDVYKK